MDGVAGTEYVKYLAPNDSGHYSIIQKCEFQENITNIQKWNKKISITGSANYHIAYDEDIYGNNYVVASANLSLSDIYSKYPLIIENEQSQRAKIEQLIRSGVIDTLSIDNYISNAQKVLSIVSISFEALYDEYVDEQHFYIVFTVDQSTSSASTQLKEFINTYLLDDDDININVAVI